jgi:multidrug efflux pump subunit AcrA (membrane-fusion protein)
VPEMGVHVAFLRDAQSGASAVASSDKRVVVPPESVQAGTDGGSAYVYVIVGSKINRRNVVLGSRERDGQVIVSGLAAGDRVAMSGFERLRDGVSVNASDI